MRLEGFQETRMNMGDIEINVNYAGSGKPILLLHGYPQTHMMWHKLAQRLVEQNFTVVVPDLRGYGDSAKPEGLTDHSNYSKRVMAEDQVKVMEALGFDKFNMVGHDRGARVAHRLALDYPEKVISCTLMDILPTYDMYQRTNMDFAKGYYHWFFLIQPVGIPERLIGSDPAFYLRSLLEAWSRNKGCFDEQMVEEYARAFCLSGAVHATCEDYRAAATIDLVHDEEDRDKKIQAPLLVLWGEKGLVGKLYDVLGVWRERAENVVGGPLPCGHFLPEEAPEESYWALIEFLKQHNSPKMGGK
ncbi:MAG: alpha/beta hydrolase [Anaerotignum sp.]|nr:alpha/beta hydrolase [Anaerotignum sp.]